MRTLSTLPVFKSVFTRETPQSRGALKDLVSACLNRDLELIAVAANEPPGSEK